MGKSHVWVQGEEKMKRHSKLSGPFCMMLLALGALAFVATNPTPARAVVVQCINSVNISKSCVTPRLVGDKDDCTITLTDTDTTCHNDYQVNSASDVVHAKAGDVPESGLAISAATPGTPSTGTACSTSSGLPCTIAPGGSVSFEDNNYTIVSGDATLSMAELDDTGTINFQNTCDNNAGGTGTGCNTTAVDENQVASTTVLTCSVSIDKQVSCDGGTTWYDVTTGTGADDPTGTLTLDKTKCVGTDAFDSTSATNIEVRYIITNTGTDALGSCSATESNGLILGTSSGTQTITGVNATFTSSATQTVGPEIKACSTALETAEGSGDTASVGCTCATPVTSGSRTVSGTDSAVFACASPGLSVVKNCSAQTSGTTNSFTIDVSNTGGVDLTNCNVTDEYQANDTCTDITLVSPVDATSSLSPTGSGNYSISAGGSLPQFSGSISGLSANACNQASVDCTISGTTTHITASGQSTCAVGTGCDTRTAGFWGTHPSITQTVLGSGLQSCGFTITSTLAVNSCSATEDICSVGSDSNTLGIAPQDMQLVRQCMAAELNFAASTIDGGSCSNTSPGIDSTLADCCGTAGVCALGGTPVNGATVDSCISALDAFNSLETTITNSTLLTSPGPADSSLCQASNGDGIVNTGPCGGARTYVYVTKTNNGKHNGKP
jgi:hypothetical protein